MLGNPYGYLVDLADGTPTNSNSSDSGSNNVHHGPFASEAMSMTASQICPNPDGTTSRCAPIWIISIPFIRLLQALLGVMLCLITAYTILNLRQISGIFSDPASIASVGSLLGNREFVSDLRLIPAGASMKDIRKSLSGNRYTLDTFTTKIGNRSYGIVKLDNDPKSYGCRTANTSTMSSDQASNTSSKFKYIRDMSLIIFSLGLLSVVLAYALDHNEDSFNDFFNSNTFGPRFILTTSATIVDNRWKCLEREVRLMQPYRQLHSRPGPKESVEALLANTASTAYTSLPIALYRGHFFLALVSFVAILSDVLIIAVAGVPFSYGQLYISFQISTWLSVSILTLMIVTSLAVMLFWRKGNPKGMPRAPDTIFAVALYLCASQVTQQLVPLSMASQEDRDREVRSWRGRYSFGRTLGRDRTERWLVDRVDGGSAPMERSERNG